MVYVIADRRRKEKVSSSSVMVDVVHGVIGIFVYAFFHLIMYIIYHLKITYNGNKQDQLYNSLEEGKVKGQ